MKCFLVPSKRSTGQFNLSVGLLFVLSLCGIGLKAQHAVEYGAAANIHFVYDDQPVALGYTSQDEAARMPSALMFDDFTDHQDVIPGNDTPVTPPQSGNEVSIRAAIYDSLNNKVSGEFEIAECEEEIARIGKALKPGVYYLAFFNSGHITGKEQFIVK